MTVRRAVSSSLAAMLFALVAWGALPRAHARPAPPDRSHVHSHDEPGTGPASPPQRVSTNTAAADGGLLGKSRALPPLPPAAHRCRVRTVPDGLGARSVSSFPPSTPARPRGPPSSID